MQAINRGGIWRFISKPWNDDDLKCTIKNAFGLYRIQEERQMLLKKLERKNGELQTLNQELERRVEERTQLIEAQKQLLQQIVDGVELPVFAAAACKTVGELVNSDHTALLHTIGTQSIVCLKDAPSEDQKHALVASLLSGKGSTDNTYVTAPIVHASVVLGTIGIACRNAAVADRIREIMANIVPIIALALGQFKMITDAPGLMNDLDDLIDRL
jgi:nitrate/nitrite-specific signal transduction histidine kinase